MDGIFPLKPILFVSLNSQQPGGRGGYEVGQGSRAYHIVSYRRLCRAALYLIMLQKKKKKNFFCFFPFLSFLFIY
jgi:hypothetical protein